MDKTQNDAPSVAFYDMGAVAFVPQDEMADVTIAGLQWFILIPRLNHTGSHRPIDSHSIPYVHRGRKYSIWNKNYPASCNPTNYKESSRSSFSGLLRHAMEKGRGPILYGKKTLIPHGEVYYLFRMR